MGEKLFSYCEPLRSEVRVVSGGEFILPLWSCGRGSVPVEERDNEESDVRGNLILSSHWSSLIIPPLLKDTCDALDPLIDLVRLIPLLPAFCGASRAILSQGEAWQGAWFYWLLEDGCQSLTPADRQKQLTVLLATS